MLLQANTFGFSSEMRVKHGDDMRRMCDTCR